MEYNLVDARGRSCPEPVIMTKKALDTHSGREHRVLVDSMVAVENIKRYAINQGYSVKVEEQEQEFTLHIKK